MPLSKQRNKHIQRVLVEAAKLAPRECHELAAIHTRELGKGNKEFQLPRLSTNCFGTGREHKLNLL